MNNKNFWQLSKIWIVAALTSLISLACDLQSIPGSTETISSILNDPVRGHKVSLTGRILKKESETGGDIEYVLFDGVEEIAIDVGDKEFEYDPDDVFNVLGTVETETDTPKQDDSSNRVEIQVKNIENITKKLNGM